MQKTKNKRQVKIIALAVAAFFALGIVGIAVTQTRTGFAAPAAGNSAIGYVETQRVMAAHPDVKAADEAMQAEVEKARKEYAEAAKNMSDQEKQRFAVQTEQRLQNKREEQMKPIMEKIEAVIKKVAEAKGIAVVVDRMVVISGGTDLTDDVIKAFGAAKK